MATCNPNNLNIIDFDFFRLNDKKDWGLMLFLTAYKDEFGKDLLIRPVETIVKYWLDNNRDEEVKKFLKFAESKEDWDTVHKIFNPIKKSFICTTQ